MLSREDRKGQTRKALMDAALLLVDQGHNFASISLREVAKNAGVVPTSFYRHFKDMEELGLNIIDDIGLMLRKLLRSARQSATSPAEATRTSMVVFTEFVFQNKKHFHFLNQVKGGGTLALRSAMRNELRHFANEMATDLRASFTQSNATALAHLSSTDLELIARFIVSAVFESTIDLLDLCETSPNYRQEYIEQTVHQLKVIWRGLINVKASGDH